MDEDRDVLDHASIETIIPDNTISSVQEVLQQTAADIENDTQALLQIKRRDLLFFDEKVRAVAVLQIPRCDEETLKSCLSRIEFRSEVWAIDRAFQEPQVPRVAGANDTIKELIAVASVTDLADPVVLVQEEADDDKSHTESLTLVWEVLFDLNRPKARIPDASIYLHSIVLVSSSQSTTKTAPDGLLVPFEPLEANVLEPLRHLRRNTHQQPYLAASRLEKVLPKNYAHNKKFRIDNMSPRYKVAPAAIARLRYSKTNPSLLFAPSVASLDIEIIPYVEVRGKIEKADASLQYGQVENLMSDFIPTECSSRDVFTLLYKLLPATGQMVPSSLNTVFGTSSAPAIDILAIDLRLRLDLSESCKPLVVMQWTTNIDLLQGSAAMSGGVHHQPQYLHHASSISAGASAGSGNLAQQANPQAERTYTSTGIIISFTASDAPGIVGRPFKWKVLVTNRSNKPIKLAIIPIPRLQRNASQAQHFAKKHAPKSSTASFHPNERRHMRAGSEDTDIAQAVVDENIVYAMQHSNVMPPETDLLSLTAELKIGPLGPGQCHESEIKLVAFEKGAMRMDVIRVVDLLKEAEQGQNAPGVIFDIRDLPDILVTDDLEV